jgi:hypothetical protein
MPRSRYILVFAESIHEANQYAKRAKLPRGSYRAVGHAGSIRGIQSADVHVLPGFEKRRDRHAIRAAVRHGRDIRYLNVEMPDALEVPPVDQGDGMGEQLTIDDAPDLMPAAVGIAFVANQFSETDKLLADQAAYAASHAVVTPAKIERVVPEGKPDWLQKLEDEGKIEPEGWEPPETLSANDILQLAAGAAGQDVAPTPTSDEDEIKAAAIKKPRKKKAEPTIVMPVDF